MMSIIPDDPFAATAGSQMATRTRIAPERVPRHARPPPARRAAHSGRKSAGFLVAINLYRDRHSRRAGPSSGYATGASLSPKEDGATGGLPIS